MTQENSRNCRYFVSYTGIKLPLKLVNPLEEAELNNRNTFFRGYYDEQDRLIFCEKMVYGEAELSHRYEYHDGGGLSLAEVTLGDGDVTVLRFDEEGQPVPDAE